MHCGVYDLQTRINCNTVRCQQAGAHTRTHLSNLPNTMSVSGSRNWRIQSMLTPLPRSPVVTWLTRVSVPSSALTSSVVRGVCNTQQQMNHLTLYLMTAGCPTSEAGKTLSKTVFSSRTADVGGAP
jgi:hypothetical protein